MDACFARDEKSVEKLFEKLEAFKGFCGLELNRHKTETLWLGKTGSQPTNLSVQHKLAHEVRLSRRFFFN